MIKKILAAIAGLATVVALFFRGQSARHKAEADRQKERADSAEASVNLRQRIDDNVAEVKNKHREEQVDEKNSFDAGDRNQLDNNW